MNRMNEICRTLFLEVYKIVGYLLLATGIIWSILILMKYIEIGGWAEGPQRRIIRPSWARLGFHSLFFILYGSLYWLIWTITIFVFEKEQLKTNTFKIGLVGMVLSVSVVVFFMFTEQGYFIFD